MVKMAVMLWKPHRHDARIANLIMTPPEESVEQQRERCAEYGALVAERNRDLGHDAYKMAIGWDLTRSQERAK